MMAAKTFRIKTGFIHILPDRLVFSFRGKLNENGEPLEKDPRWWHTALDGLLIGILLFGALYLFTISRPTLAIILVVMVLYRLVNLVLNLFRRNIRQISRKDIRRIAIRDGIKGLSRARVIIHFRNQKGKRRRKLIILRDAISGGNEETDQLYYALKDEKLIN